MNIQAPKSERIAARITPEQKSLLTEAAALRGRSLTEFVIETAQREAQVAIDEARLIRLSGDHQRRLAEVLLNPPKPNAALTEAARAYDEKDVSST